MKFNLEDSISVLARTPNILSDLISNLSEDWTLNNEGGHTWSPYDIIGHLIHGEKTDWIPRAKIILSELQDKNFEPFDRFAQFENSKGKTLKQLLDEFRQVRAENIDYLKNMNLSSEQLELTGIHPEFGTVMLKELLATWVVHDFSHINQITRVMAKNYKEEVGPWTQYISFLKG